MANSSKINDAIKKDGQELRWRLYSSFVCLWVVVFFLFPFLLDDFFPRPVLGFFRADEFVRWSVFFVTSSPNLRAWEPGVKEQKHTKQSTPARLSHGNRIRNGQQQGVSRSTRKLPGMRQAIPRRCVLDSQILPNSARDWLRTVGALRAALTAPPHDPAFRTVS